MNEALRPLLIVIRGVMFGQIIGLSLSMHDLKVEAKHNLEQLIEINAQLKDIKTELDEIKASTVNRGGKHE